MRNFHAMNTTADYHNGPWEIPGGDGYADVTSILASAAPNLGIEDVLFMENFTLMDALSAIEIMDPRMDSGVAHPPSPNDAVVPFNPSAELLPEEVCWIIDRSLAAEMAWHSGNSLAQTIFTLLYMHELPNLQHNYFNQNFRSNRERPEELVTEVLRAATYGLVKSCDLAWREFTKNHVYDGEDFNGEKFDVSMCENYYVSKIIEMLDEAVLWLEYGLEESIWRDPLVQRLELRKVLLSIFATPPSDEKTSAKTLANVITAKALLGLIRSGIQPPTPSFTSPALAAFDPNISSKLVSHAPLRRLELPNREEAWNLLEAMLEGIFEACTLSTCDSILSWKTLLSVRASEPPSFRRSAYVRSLTVSAFPSSAAAPKFNSYTSPNWVVSELLLEVALIPYSLPTQLYNCIRAEDLSYNGLRDALTGFQSRSSSLTTHYYSCLSHNRPRQRRNFSKALRDWHELHRDALDLVKRVRALIPQRETEIRLVERIPLVVLHIRLTLVTDVIFSGFEVELYDLSEWSFLYWYASTIFAHQHKTLLAIKNYLDERETASSSGSLDYLNTQMELASALRDMCSATVSALARVPLPYNHPPDRQRANIERRLKWAHPAGAEAQDQCDVTSLDFVAYERDVQRISTRPPKDARQEEIQLFTQARTGLFGLTQRSAEETMSTLCEPLYKGFLAGLLKTCDANAAVLRKGANDERAAADVLVARHVHHSWFPVFSEKE